LVDIIEDIMKSKVNPSFQAGVVSSRKQMGFSPCDVLVSWRIDIILEPVSAFGLKPELHYIL